MNMTARLSRNGTGCLVIHAIQYEQERFWQSRVLKLTNIHSIQQQSSKFSSFSVSQDKAVVESNGSASRDLAPQCRKVVELPISPSW